jgi:autotransporter-associated beta strand protein
MNSTSRRRLLAISISTVLAVTASAQLQWDPTGGAAGAQGGSGDWLTSNGGNPWWNGTNNVNWADGSDALFGGSAGDVTSGGVIVDDITFGPTGYTVSGSITLGMGDGIHEISNPGNATISAALSGTEGLVKLGIGSLTLSGNNTYTGPTTINAGTLVAAGANPIGATSSVTVAAGASLTFDFSFPKTIGDLSGAGSVSLGQQVTVGGSNASTTFSGPITSPGSSGSLRKTGTGTLTLTGTLSYGGGTTIDNGTLKLTGTNTYGSSTVINGGTLEVSGGNAIPDGSGVIVAGPGVLQLVDNEAIKSLSGSGAVMLGSNTLTISANGSSNTGFAGIISGGGSVKTGLGILTLSGANSFTGGITIAGGGPVLVPDFGSTGTNGPLGPGTVTLDGGELAYSGTGTTGTDRPISIAAAGGKFNGGLGTLMLNGVLSGPGKVTISSGVVWLTNPANSFTGGIRIISTLALSDVPDNGTTSVLGASGPITLFGGTLAFKGTGTDSSNRQLIYDGIGTIDVPAGTTLTLNSASGSGNFRKRGPGTLIQTDPTNSFTGSVFIEDGTLQTGDLADAGVPSALGTGGFIGFQSPTVTTELVLPAGASGSTNRAIGLSAGGGRIRISNSTITLNSPFSGNGPITFAGSDSNTDTIILNATYPMGGDPRTTGRTILDRVKVQVGGGGLPVSGPVELTDNTGAWLNLIVNTTIGSLQGGGGPNQGRVTLNSGLTIGSDNSDTNFAGVIEGNGGLTIIGSGICNLTGVNTFTGNVSLNRGKLVVADVANSGMPSSLGSGSSLVFGGNNSPAGTLVFLGNGTDATNRNLFIQGFGGHIDVSDPNGTLVWSGPINGGVVNPVIATLTKEGSGTLRLTGANSYSGSTEIKAGKLQVLGSNALPNFGNVNVFAGASFELLPGTNETIGSLEGSGSLILGGQRLITGGNELPTTFSGLISGAGGSQIEKTGGGTFILTNPGSSFSGGVTIADGAVSIPLLADAGMNSPLGSNGAVTLGDSTHTGRLVVTNSGGVSTNRPILVSQGGGIIEVSNDNAEVTLTGSISGSAPLLKFGSGRLKFTGDKTYGGSLIVADGTLRLDGSIPGTPITVLDPGTLDSSGSISRTIGPLTFSGGTVSPGLPGTAGTFSTGNVTFSTGRFAIDLLDATASELDYLNVTGAVEFTGPVSLTIALGFDPLDDVDVFRIVVNDGTDVTALQNGTSRFTFNGNVLDEGEHFLVNSNSISQLFEIRYGLSTADNDVRLIAVPEPATAILVGLGGFAALARRNRRRLC